MKLRVGVVGCGSISEFRHFPEYTNRDDVELVACYDSNRARAEKMSAQFGVKVVDSVEAVPRTPPSTPSASVRRTTCTTS